MVQERFSGSSPEPFLKRFPGAPGSFLKVRLKQGVTYIPPPWLTQRPPSLGHRTPSSSSHLQAPEKTGLI